MLFSSHILQEVEAICDRVIIINKGELVADDKLSQLQAGNRENHVVIVQFKEPVKKELLEQLTQITGLDQIQSNHYKLHTSNPEIVRKQILELALSGNLNIVSLQSENQSLEEIFRLLTNAGNLN